MKIIVKNEDIRCDSAGSILGLENRGMFYISLPEKPTENIKLITDNGNPIGFTYFLETSYIGFKTKPVGEIEVEY